MNEIYSKRYFNITYKDNKNLEKRFNLITNLNEKYSDNKKRVKRVLSFLKKRFRGKNINALDIGSGMGVFLYELRKNGINCTGIERDNRYVYFCKKKHDLNILNKDIFKIKKKKFTFNFISCNKVLEHLENPAEFLRSFRKFCKV